jgi:hypothetical protein
LHPRKGIIGEGANLLTESKNLAEDYNLTLQNYCSNRAVLMKLLKFFAKEGD